MNLTILPEEFDLFGSNRVHNFAGTFSKDKESKENVDRFTKILEDLSTAHLAFVPNQFGRLPVHYAVDRSSCSLIFLKLFYKHYKKFYATFYSSLKDLEKDSSTGNISDSSIYILHNVRKCINMRDSSGISPYEIAVKWGHSKGVKILLLKMLLIVLLVQNKADAPSTIDQHVDSLTLVSEKKTGIKMAPIQFSQCLESSGPQDGTNTIIPRDGGFISNNFEEDEEEDWSGTAADVSRHDGVNDIPVEVGDTAESVIALLRREQYGSVFSPVVALSASLLHLMGSSSTSSVSASASTAIRKRSLSLSLSVPPLQNQVPTQPSRSCHGVTAAAVALSSSSHTEDCECRIFNEYPYPDESRTSSDTSSAHSVASSHLLGSQNRSLHRRQQRESSMQNLEGIGEKDESAASPRTNLEDADGGMKRSGLSPNFYGRYRSKSSSVFPDDNISNNSSSGANNSKKYSLSSGEGGKFLDDDENRLKASKSAYSLLSVPNEGSPTIARRYSKSAHSALSPSLGRRGSSPPPDDTVLSLVGLGQNDGAHYGPEAGSWAGHIRRSQLFASLDGSAEEKDPQVAAAVTVPLEDSIS